MFLCTRTEPFWHNGFWVVIELKLWGMIAYAYTLGLMMLGFTSTSPAMTALKKMV